MKEIWTLLIIFSGVLGACNSSESTTKQNNANTTSGEKEYNEYLEQKRRIMIGKPIKNFTVQTVNGKQYDLSNMEGKVVILNFWFEACKPCITEIPSLNQLQKDFEAQGVMVLGVSLDKSSTVSKVMKEKNMLYQNVASGHSIAKELKVTTYPTTFLIDKKGIIREMFVGADSFDATQTYLEIKPHLKKLLEK